MPAAGTLQTLTDEVNRHPLAVQSELTSSHGGGAWKRGGVGLWSGLSGLGQGTF